MQFEAKPKGTIARALLPCVTSTTKTEADESSSDWELEEELADLLDVGVDKIAEKAESYQTADDIECEQTFLKPQQPSEPPWHKQDFKVDKDVMVCIL